jgi:demethylmenaquinone methyltransferase / 2-methoxy-6-polyprenyl-1,4-benzoquinol methylase
MTSPNSSPAAEDKARAVRSMFDSIAHRYDLVNRVMTFGLDVGWRRRAVRELQLDRGAVVLDVACGTGDFCRELLRAGKVAVGLDFSAGMLAVARTDAPLVQGDALSLPVAPGSLDGITCGFALRNVADIGLLLGEFARGLRTGGRIAVLEVAEPVPGLLRAGHGLYFKKVVPVIGGLLSDRSAYRYLPESAAYLPPPEELVRIIEVAGFTDVRRTALALGAAQLLTGTRAA